MDLFRDVKQSFRLMSRRPGFTAVIVLSIALGVGANTAIFSIANLLVVRPLPYPEDYELMRIRSYVAIPGRDPQRTSISAFNIKALRDQSELFEDFGAWIYGTYNIVGGDEPIQVHGSMASANSFSVMGVEPLIGRDIAPEEDQPGNPAHVVVLSHALWRTQFGGDEDILGKSLKINEQPHLVIGVMPPYYEYPYMTKLWVPLGMEPGRELRFQHVHHVVGRLKDGISPEAGNQELIQIGERLAQEFPDTHENWSFGLQSVRDDLTHEALDVEAKVVLVPLLVASGFLLLIACANVANMLLGRSIEQSHEVALQMALGISRRQLIRQLLVHGMILALLGGTVGLFLAYWTFKPMVALSPADQTNVVFQEIQLDHRVLLFTLLTSLVVGILFSLAPALKTSNPNLQSILMEGNRTTPSRSGRHLLKATVIAEVAVAVILLVGSGLMYRSLLQLRSADVGFASDDVLVMNLTLPEVRYPEHAQQVAYLQQVIEATEAVPGVKSAGTTTLFPLRSAIYLARLLPEGLPADDPESLLLTNHRVVSPGLLETMGIPLLKGRLLNRHDQADSEPVVVISENLAKHAFPGQDPIDRRLSMVVQSGLRPWMRVVGVVGNVKDNGERENTWYMPFTQMTWPAEFMDVVVRTEINPSLVLPSIREAIWEVNPEQAMADVMTSNDLMARQFWGQRSTTYLMLMFAGLGLLLAIVGIYGIQSYFVVQQTHEMGVRMVFGAQPKDVVREILKKGMVMALAGLAIGIVGSLLLTRYLGSLLYGVSPTDPATYLGISLVILTVALIANFVPARRATRVDPLEILKY